MSKKYKVYLVNYDRSINDMFRYSADFEIINSVDKGPDILVFDGGPDVSPELYGEKALPRTYPDKSKEKWNKKHYEEFPNAMKVGICFGGQWLNVMSGGAMFQDVNNHGRTHKIVNLLNMTKYFPSGQELDVTSTHHQMMIPGSKGEVLAIANEATSFASAKDRPKPEFDTEVIWYPETKCLCFQPHPEYSSPAALGTRDYFFTLLKYFL